MPIVNSGLLSNLVTLVVFFSSERCVSGSPQQEQNLNSFYSVPLTIPPQVRVHLTSVPIPFPAQRKTDNKTMEMSLNSFNESDSCSLWSLGSKALVPGGREAFPTLWIPDCISRTFRFSGSFCARLPLSAGGTVGFNLSWLLDGPFYRLLGFLLLLFSELGAWPLLLS